MFVLRCAEESEVDFRTPWQARSLRITVAATIDQVRFIPLANTLKKIF